jgi:hypothetical protein
MLVCLALLQINNGSVVNSQGQEVLTRDDLLKQLDHDARFTLVDENTKAPSNFFSWKSSSQLQTLL